MAAMKMRPIKFSDEAWREVGAVAASVGLNMSEFVRQATEREIVRARKHAAWVNTMASNEADATGTP